jgi:hypothetical protein
VDKLVKRLRRLIWHNGSEIFHNDGFSRHVGLLGALGVDLCLHAARRRRSSGLETGELRAPQGDENHRSDDHDHAAEAIHLRHLSMDFNLSNKKKVVQPTARLSGFEKYFCVSFSRFSLGLTHTVTF